MQVCNQNNNYRPNFASIKLANLHLKKVLPDSSYKNIPSELHELEASDLPLLNKIYNNQEVLEDGMFIGVYEHFLDSINSKANRLNPNKKFYAVINNKGNLTAVAEATVEDSDISLDLISNFNSDKSVKGSGTSIIIALVELAKKMQKKSLYVDVSLCDSFYSKLGFNTGTDALDNDFTLPASKYKTFLKKFKHKYIQDDTFLPELTSDNSSKQKATQTGGFLKRCFQKLFNRFVNPTNNPIST